MGVRGVVSTAATLQGARRHSCESHQVLDLSCGGLIRFCVEEPSNLPILPGRGRSLPQGLLARPVLCISWGVPGSPWAAGKEQTSQETVCRGWRLLSYLSLCAPLGSGESPSDLPQHAFQTFLWAKASSKQ